MMLIWTFWLHVSKHGSETDPKGRVVYQAYPERESKATSPSRTSQATALRGACYHWIPQAQGRCIGQACKETEGWLEWNWPQDHQFTFKSSTWWCQNNDYTRHNRIDSTITTFGYTPPGCHPNIGVRIQPTNLIFVVESSQKILARPTEWYDTQRNSCAWAAAAVSTKCIWRTTTDPTHGEEQRARALQDEQLLLQSILLHPTNEPHFIWPCDKC